MNLSGLSFENIPPLSVPLRFFQTAPVFGILAALLLLCNPEAFESRWQPSLFAFTHLLTLGFGALVMLGALFQVMPVVTGQSLPAGARVAPIVRWSVATGALLLAAGFKLGQPLLFGVATLLLVIGFGVFIAAFSTVLFRIESVGDSAFCLRFAAIALAITVALGMLQASVHYWPAANLYRPAHTDLHVIWGGMGWVLGLIIAVAIQVIPMFHVTPAFPRWLSKGLVPSLFGLLVISSLYLWPTVQSMALTAIAFCSVLFAISGLGILNQRKRKLIDWTVRFWRLGLVHLLIISALILLHRAAPNLQHNDTALLIGLGFGLGFVVTVMIGMLQKIVPFLIYLHLQRACLTNPAAMMQLPNMKEIIPTRTSRVQFYLHCAMLVSIYAAIFIAHLRPLAGLVMLLSFGWLALTLFKSSRLHAATLAKIVT